MISAEHNTSVRITDEVSLLNWFPHFAVQLLNKMRTGRRWKEPMVQFGEKFWFHEIGQEGINSSVKRRIQGIFVGHHDRNKSNSTHCPEWNCARPKSDKGDAWESTIMEYLFGNPAHHRLHTAIGETKLKKKFITGEGGKDRLLLRVLAEKPLEVERRKIYVLSADIEAQRHMGSCPGYALLASQGKVTKLRRDEFRKRVGTTIEKTSGEARIDACKDRIAETQRVREKRRARIERGAVDVPEEPGNKDDEQVAVRHADASGCFIIEKQHEEKNNERHPSQQKRIRGNK